MEITEGKLDSLAAQESCPRQVKDEAGQVMMMMMNGKKS